MFLSKCCCEFLPVLATSPLESCFLVCGFIVWVSVGWRVFLAAAGGVLLVSREKKGWQTEKRR